MEDKLSGQNSFMTRVSRQERKLGKLAESRNTDAHWLWVQMLSLIGADNFEGQQILDIGAGSGLYSCALAALDADQVVALEPVGNGSRSDHLQQFEETITVLGLSNIKILELGIQEYVGSSDQFDYIVMHNVVNHLDEEAVQTLDHSEKSRKRYRELLSPLLQLLRPGGIMIIRDAQRSHMLSPLMKWGILKRHPRAKTIEWEKHQDPAV